MSLFASASGARSAAQSLWARNDLLASTSDDAAVDVIVNEKAYFADFLWSAALTATEYARAGIVVQHNEASDIITITLPTN